MADPYNIQLANYGASILNFIALLDENDEVVSDFQAVTWTAADQDGRIDADNTPLFIEVPAGTEVTGIGFFETEDPLEPIRIETIPTEPYPNGGTHEVPALFVEHL